MNYQILNYQPKDGRAVAGILVKDSVYDVVSLPGLAHCPTVIDILNDWRKTEKLLQDAADSIATSAPAGLRLADVELLAPIPNPGAVYCCGANYTDHINEMRPMVKDLPADIAERELLGDEPWHFIRRCAEVSWGPAPACENREVRNGSTGK